MGGLTNNLRFHDDDSERQTGEISCSSLDASPVVSAAKILVGYGIGPNHEFTVHSAEELYQACLDGLIAEKQTYPGRRLPLLLYMRIGGKNYGPTSAEMWPWNESACFIVPFDREPNPNFPEPPSTPDVLRSRFAAFWAAIGKLSNHAANLNAMCGRIAEAVE